MTPATPPRSSQRRRSVDTSLGTPQGGQQLGVPVTPSTVQKFKNNIPVLQQPFSANPFSGLKSPERSPFPVGSARRGSVKRSLFPSSEDEVKQSARPVARSLFDSLLPVESSSSQVPRLHIPEENNEETDEERIRKQAKNLPGTPGDKVITFEMAKQWNNVSSKEGTTVSDTEEEEETVTVSSVNLKNPFMDDTVLTREERSARHQKLLSENPELESTVTYVNKHGLVVNKRHLSSKDQARYKPRALFTDED